MGPRRLAYGNEEGPHRADVETAALAARQHGVISTAQLRGLGMTSKAIHRRVATGRLQAIPVTSVARTLVAWLM